jgi:hypothetical protein
LVCSGLGLGGCGKSDDGEGIALEDLAAAEADAHCASIEPCCQEDGRDFDPVECRQVAQEVIDGWLGVIDWSRFSYDAQAAADCLAAARGHTACEAKLVDFDVPACERIFPGKVPGGQCRHEDECQQSSSQSADCVRDPAASIDADGTCEVEARTPLAHGELGVACEETCDLDDSCTRGANDDIAASAGEGVGCYFTDGLYCSFVNETCQRLVTVGNSCDDDEGCTGDAFCDRETGVCTARRPAGEPCDSPSQCESDECGTDSGACETPTVSAMACAEYFDRH